METELFETHAVILNVIDLYID